MSRILFTYERNMATVSSMILGFSSFSEKWKMQMVSKCIKDLSAEDIDNADVLLMIRPEDVLSWRIARKAREAGCFIITFCDDNLLNCPSDMPRVPWKKAGLRKTLSYSHAVMSSSKYLCEQYKDITTDKRTCVIDTVVQPEEIISAETQKGESSVVKIVYAAAPGHVALFDKYVRNAFGRIVERYGKRISWTFISVHPDLSEYTSDTCINYVKGMPLMEYRKYMESQRFDIGIAPGEDSEFFKCKYFNKFIEYTMQRVTGVYSNLEPYITAVKDRQNGYLTENTDQSWYEVLCDAIDHPEERRKLVDNAVEYLKTYHAEDAIVARMIQDLPEIQMYSAKRTPCKGFFLDRIRYYCLRPLDLVYLTLFYFKHTGLHGVIQKTKVHLREGKAYKS